MGTNEIFGRKLRDSFPGVGDRGRRPFESADPEARGQRRAGQPRRKEEETSSLENSGRNNSQKQFPLGWGPGAESVKGYPWAWGAVSILSAWPMFGGLRPLREHLPGQHVHHRPPPCRSPSPLGRKLVPNRSKSVQIWLKIVILSSPKLKFQRQD